MADASADSDSTSNIDVDNTLGVSHQASTEVSFQISLRTSDIHAR